MMTKQLVLQHLHLYQALATLVYKIPKTPMNCDQRDGKSLALGKIQSHKLFYPTWNNGPVGKVKGIFPLTNLFFCRLRQNCRQR